MSKLSSKRATRVTTTATLDKVTKGAARYRNDQEEQAITTIYLRRETIPEPPPLQIRITLEL